MTKLAQRNVQDALLAYTVDGKLRIRVLGAHFPALVPIVGHVLGTSVHLVRPLRPTDLARVWAYCRPAITLSRC